MCHTIRLGFLGQPADWRRVLFLNANRYSAVSMPIATLLSHGCLSVAQLPGNRLFDQQRAVVLLKTQQVLSGCSASAMLCCIVLPLSCAPSMLCFHSGSVSLYTVRHPSLSLRLQLVKAFGAVISRTMEAAESAATGGFDLVFQERLNRATRCNHILTQVTHQHHLCIDNAK